MELSWGDWTALLSAGLGASGALLLLFAIFRYEGRAGALQQDATVGRSDTGVFYRKLGLLMLCVSFLLQGLAVLLQAAPA
jgi:hypothetical protein